mgnify:CR=1 FL=1
MKIVYNYLYIRRLNGYFDDESIHRKKRIKPVTFVTF